MVELTYKQTLKQTAINFGVNQDELKYWDFLLAGITEQMAGQYVETFTKYPELFNAVHHDLIKKGVFLNTRGSKADWDKIIEEEKQELMDIISANS